MRHTIAFAMAGALAAGSAHAQDVYVEDKAYGSAPYVDHRAYVPPEAVEPEAVAPGAAAGPRVYGWNWVEIRPEDCGTFKYWNGQYCADARVEPPPAD